MLRRVLIATLTALLTLAGSALFAASAAQAADRGSYTVSGLGARKQALLNNGGDTLDMAIAMLETDNMQSWYRYGDGKTYDAANFGIFKQNWGMIRACTPQYRGLSAGDYNAGAALNGNLSWDVQVLNMCQRHYGTDRFFGGHRNGSTGLNNPYTQDITNYKNAIYWIKSQIDSNSRYRTDDTRFWVNVPAI